MSIRPQLGRPLLVVILASLALATLTVAAPIGRAQIIAGPPLTPAEAALVAEKEALRQSLLDVQAGAFDPALQSGTEPVPALSANAMRFADPGQPVRTFTTTVQVTKARLLDEQVATLRDLERLGAEALAADSSGENLDGSDGDAEAGISRVDSVRDKIALAEARLATIRALPDDYVETLQVPSAELGTHSISISGFTYDQNTQKDPVNLVFYGVGSAYDVDYDLTHSTWCRQTWSKINGLLSGGTLGTVGEVVTDGAPVGGAVEDREAIGEVIADGAADAPRATCPGQYYGQYWSNQTFSGSPRFSRCENWPIDYNWYLGGPGSGLGNDYFSVRWSGSAYIAPGNYTFVAKADDGIRVWIGGSLILDGWRDQAETEYRTSRSVGGGWYDVRVDYYERSGFSRAYFKWSEDRPLMECGSVQRVMIYDQQHVGGWDGWRNQNSQYERSATIPFLCGQPRYHMRLFQSFVADSHSGGFGWWSISAAHHESWGHIVDGWESAEQEVEDSFRQRDGGTYLSFVGSIWEAQIANSGTYQGQYNDGRITVIKLLR
jgi:hypothetical protein